MNKSIMIERQTTAKKQIQLNYNKQKIKLQNEEIERILQHKSF